MDGGRQRSSHSFTRSAQQSFLVNYQCQSSNNKLWTLVRSQREKDALGDDETYEKFHPNFTYPVSRRLLSLPPQVIRTWKAHFFQIYGEEEKIYGYQDLVIDVSHCCIYAWIEQASLLASICSCVLHLVHWNNILLWSIPRNWGQRQLWMTWKAFSNDLFHQVWSLNTFLIKFLYFLGYHRDEASFLSFVENDAITFKPQGQKIFSYPRPLPHSPTTKGKGKSSIQDLDPQSEDVIEFEVYYVRYLPALLVILYYSTSSSTPDDVGHPWFPRISSSDAIVCAAVHRRRIVYQWRWRYLGICYFVGWSARLYTGLVISLLRFEKRKRRDASREATYHFVGYSSLYPFYHFPEKVRLRLRWYIF